MDGWWTWLDGYTLDVEATRVPAVLMKTVVKEWRGRKCLHFWFKILTLCHIFIACVQPSLKVIFVLICIQHDFHLPCFFCKDLKHTSSSDLSLPPKVNPRLRVFLGRGKVLIITNPSRIISTIRVAPRFLHQVHQQGNKLGFIKRSLKACLKTLDMRHRNSYKFSWSSRWESDMHVCIKYMYYENTLTSWSFRFCFLVIWLLRSLCLIVKIDQYCCFFCFFFKGQLFYRTQVWS